MSDELLIVRCRLGEREAFAELVRAWHEPVWTYVRRMLGDSRAEDVTQEIWLAVFRGLPRLRDPARFAPWLFTIARRAVTDLLRAEYARPEVADAADEGLHDGGRIVVRDGRRAVGRDGGGVVPADGVDAVVDRAALAEVLGALPVREREVLILHYLDDLPVETCAQICGVPAGTVKSRLNRARRLLRAELIEKGYPR